MKRKLMTLLLITGLMSFTALQARANGYMGGLGGMDNDDKAGIDGCRRSCKKDQADCNKKGYTSESYCRDVYEKCTRDCDSQYSGRNRSSGRDRDDGDRNGSDRDGGGTHRNDTRTSSGRAEQHRNVSGTVHAEMSDNRDELERKLKNNENSRSIWLDQVCSQKLSNDWRGVADSVRINSITVRRNDRNDPDFNWCMGWKFCGFVTLEGSCAK
jgi:hypothetical protein